MGSSAESSAEPPPPPAAAKEVEKFRARLPDKFPEGMRVLVVDDDPTCLKLIKRLLESCTYDVTTSSNAAKALSLLRQNKGAFDLIISDVYMPDMDGFKLLEIVGLEMDLPVIMMSGDTRFNIVIKGISHGACDFLVKPIRIFELQNIWQHVARRYLSEHKETDNSGIIEEAEGNSQAGIGDAVDVAAGGSMRYQKKKRESKEDDDGELDDTNPSSSKKPRVVWTMDLHQKFMNAVNQIGLDKAVPKRILEMMNEPGLTRENVASHLQKFRLYLKKVSFSQQVGLANSHFCTSSNANMGQLGGLDIRTLAVSSEISPQILAALQDELLGRAAFNLATPARNRSVMQLSNSLQGSESFTTERGTFFSQSEQRGKGISSFPSRSFNSFSALGSSSNSGVSNTSHKNNMMMAMLHQQHNSELLPSEVPNLIQRQSSLHAPTISSDNIQIHQGLFFSVQDSHGVSNTSHKNNMTMAMLHQQKNSERLPSEAPNLIQTQSSLLAPAISSDTIQISQGPLFSVQDSHGVPFAGVNGFPAGGTIILNNENSVPPASQALTNFQTGNNFALINQGAVGVQSQPLTSSSLKKNPLLLNQSQTILPAQALMNLQTRRHGFPITHNSMLDPYQSPSMQSEDNFLDNSINCDSRSGIRTVNYSQFPSHLSNGSNMGQIFVGSRNSTVVSYALPTSYTSLQTSSDDNSNSRQVKSPDENIGLPNGSSSTFTNSSNILTAVGMSTNFPDQHQGRNLSFLKSQFSKDGVDSSNSSRSTEDNEFLLNQDISE